MTSQPCFCLISGCDITSGLQSGWYHKWKWEWNWGTLLCHHEGCQLVCFIQLSWFNIITSKSLCLPKFWWSGTLLRDFLHSHKWDGLWWLAPRPYTVLRYVVGVCPWQWHWEYNDKITYWLDQDIIFPIEKMYSGVLMKWLDIFSSWRCKLILWHATTGMALFDLLKNKKQRLLFLP